MRKLEVKGELRTLKECTKTLHELECTIKVPRRLDMVPVRIDGINGYALVGEHLVSVQHGVPSQVQISLLLGANGSLDELSEPLDSTSEETQIHVLNILRRYSMHPQYRASGAIFGLSYKGKRWNELVHYVQTS